MAGMQEYEYICVTLKGEYLRGELSAEDKHDLIVQLWMHNLFLVWWKTHEISPVTVQDSKAPAPTVPDPRPIKEEDARALWNSVEGERRSGGVWLSAKGLPVSFLTRPQVMLAVIILFVGTATYDVYYLMTKPRLRQKTQVLSPRSLPPSVLTNLQKIRTGMTRE